MKPYPEYKDSGVEWLGMVPAHWTMEALNRLAYIQPSNVDKHTKLGEIPVRLCNYTDVYKRTFIHNGIEFMKATATQAEIDKFTLQKGDVLITKDSEVWTDIAVPAFVTEELEGVLCGYHLTHIRPYTGIIGEYIFRSFQALPIAYQFWVSAKGVTRYGIDTYSIKSSVFLLPPPDEQAAIVAFLDAAETRIRRYIRSKQKLIKLLNEQKQAIIQQAVTRGLDPDMPMKESGVEWLGMIPAHWEVRRLGHLITLQRGFDITKEEQLPGDIPVVSSGGISSYHNEATTDAPGIVLGRKGSVGSIHYIETPFGAHDTTLFVKEFFGNHPRFIYYLLTKMDLIRSDTGSSNPTLNRNLLHPEPVPYTDREEQIEIACFLDKHTLQIDQVIQVAKGEIKFISEY